MLALSIVSRVHKYNTPLLYYELSDSNDLVADMSARFYYKELIEFDADLAFPIWHRPRAPSLTLRGGFGTELILEGRFFG